MLPIIILGGIYGGIFTPTEAAAIGVVYALFVGMVVYREVKVNDLPKVLIDSAVTAAMVSFIIGAANILSWIMSVTNASVVISGILMKFVSTQFIYLIVLTIFLIFVGALMDTIAAIIIFAPSSSPSGSIWGWILCIWACSLSSTWSLVMSRRPSATTSLPPARSPACPSTRLSKASGRF